MGTSTPRSITSKPADSIIMMTRFLPMSCRSPATVPMIILPMLPTPPSDSRGLSTSTPFFMALAATSISGTKISFFEKRSPTTLMASIMVFSMSLGARPASSASWTTPGVFFALPAMTISATSCNVAIMDIPLLII